MLTILGGKWTTYRKMSQDAVDKAIEVGKLKPMRPCQTRRIKIIGAENWEPAFFTVIAQDFKVRKSIDSLVELLRE
jgi:glycerol-3-phosphate dehydrogenase